MKCQMVMRQRPANGSDVQCFGREKAQQVQSFHRSFPGYAPTPLAELPQTAAALELGGFYVKDESRRFGLNAFKVLGGSYAIGSYIAERLGLDMAELSFTQMTGTALRQRLGELTFVTATDGNHGRGIAWTANRLQQKSVVYMPQGSASERLENIRRLGADASILPVPYDDAVRHAKAQAAANGWVLVQDTDGPDYTKIPAWIMQGYTTMAWEAFQQLQGRRPTHIFLQAGVGSMAGAVTAFFADVYGDGPDAPRIIIVEPEHADCIFRTAAASDGQLHFAAGPMKTIMAGLACGEPCGMAWSLLRDHADAFVSMPDEVSALGMRLLGNPLPGDDRVISGESGAAGAGLAAALMRCPELAGLKEKLGLNEQSQVLCFSTEGATDRENYRRVVWDGAWPIAGN